MEDRGLFKLKPPKGLDIFSVSVIDVRWMCGGCAVDVLSMYLLARGATAVVYRSYLV